ncbi:hypothetical protein RB653_007107 [Dictyostelium firmibasis]|uniref:protein xylosyltransferase n=1 Tax=Dictyostelium firmibasis TaxID=79012 RepID=A0AAN7YNQ8_9MYCE
MKIIVFIALFLIIYFLKCEAQKYNNNIHYKLCQNGGISININNCICPPSYSGDHCEIIDNNDICTNATYFSDSFGPLCCFSKLRDNINLSELELTMNINSNNKNKNNKSQENEIINELLKTYGPWEEKDVKLLDYLLISCSEKGENYLKYSDYFYGKEKQLQHLLDSSNCDDLDNPNPLAFVLILSSIDYETIDILFQILYRPYNYYVIHVDENSIINYEELELFFKKIEDSKKFNSTSTKKWNNYPSNIKIMKNRFKGAWGSISLVYLELSAYTILFDMVDERIKSTGESFETTQWSHVINLSGNDMPTIPLSNFSKILCKTKRKSYLDHCCIKDHFRFDRNWIQFNEKNQLIELFPNFMKEKGCGDGMGMSKYYDRKKVYGDGSQWKFLNVEYVKYLISDLKSLERLLTFKFSFIPDESFFQSSKIYFESNSGYHSFEIDTKRMTMFENNPEARDHTRYAVELKDIPNLHGLYFVRKVYLKEVKDAIIKEFNLLTEY